MAKEKDSKKRKEKKEKKAKDSTKEIAVEEPVKSIADLFGTTSRDPILDALFKSNVSDDFRLD